LLLQSLQHLQLSFVSLVKWLLEPSSFIVVDYPDICKTTRQKKTPHFCGASPGSFFTSRRIP
jgi:hypothetical protein